MLKESLSAGPGGRRALASLSHVFQYTTIDTNEKKINLREGKGLLRGKRRGSKGARDFNAPKDPRKTSEVISPRIKVINTKWINVFSCLALLRSPSSHAAFLSFWEWIPFRSARFDDTDSSWSLRSNYSCPVKYHNAPKDQFTAWGALSYPLKPQFQPLWKLVHTNPWTLMNTAQDKTRTIMKIAS